MELFVYLPYIFTENHWRYTTGSSIAIFRATTVFFGRYERGQHSWQRLCWSLFLKRLQAFRPATLLKRNFNTSSGVFIPSTFIFRVLTEPYLGPPKHLWRRFFVKIGNIY